MLSEVVRLGIQETETVLRNHPKCMQATLKTM